MEYNDNYLYIIYRAANFKSIEKSIWLVWLPRGLLTMQLCAQALVYISCYIKTLYAEIFLVLSLIIIYLQLFTQSFIFFIRVHTIVSNVKFRWNISTIRCLNTVVLRTISFFFFKLFVSLMKHLQVDLFEDIIIRLMRCDLITQSTNSRCFIDETRQHEWR